MRNSVLKVASRVSLALLVAGCSQHGSGGGGGTSVAASATATSTTTRTTGSTQPTTGSTQPTTGSTQPTGLPAASTSLVALPLPSGPVGGPRAKGVDVSKYEGTVDWAKAAAAGTNFGIARVSDGINTHDATFLPNWTGMKSHGVVRGVYQFFRPSQDPIVQADYLVSQVGSIGAGDLPPFCDVETLDNLAPATVTANLQKWIARVESKLGVTPAIYSSARVWKLLNNPTGFSMSDLWVANWGVSAPAMPPIWKDWTFWQYSASGAVNGIQGSPGVDVSVFNGSLDDLEAYARLATPSGFFRGVAVDSTNDGVWTCGYDGGVFAYGDATFRGTAGGKAHPEPILGIVRTPTGFGYWLFRADGAVLPFGDATNVGDLATQALAAPIVGMAATPSGKGYWLLAQDGSVTAFGDASSVGQPGAPVAAVGIARTATSKGYWIACADGSVRAFGDAATLGDVAGKIAQPVTAIAATPTGKGYWVVEADGGVQAFGDAPSVATTRAGSGAPVIGICSSLGGQGYWLLDDAGNLTAAGDATDTGSRPR